METKEDKLKLKQEIAKFFRDSERRLLKYLKARRG